MTATDGTTRTPAPRRVVALHPTGDGIGLVALQRSNGGPPAVQAAEQVARADVGTLAKAVARFKPDVVVGVVPASESICRCVEAPEEHSLAGDAFTDVLALIAEGELGNAAPAHRRAAGRIRLPGDRAVVLAQGWPEARSADPALDGVVDCWITEPAAMARLLEEAGTPDGHGVIVRTVPGTETGCAVIAGPQRVVARVVRPAAGVTIDDGMADAIEESCRRAGIGPADRRPARAGLSLVPHRQAAFGGGARTDDWLDRFGLAWAAADLAVDPDPARRSVCAMRANAPSPHRALPIRLFEWASRPRHAAAVVAVCLAVMLLAPYAAAQARHALLERRSGGVDELAERLETAQRESAFYGLLRERRQPMTKLVADVVGAAPVGVRFEMLEITREGGLTVRASANETSLVTEFRDRLQRTRVFNAIELPNRSEERGVVEFQLSAAVANAFYRATPVEDFGEETLAQRLHGPEAAGWSASDTSYDGDSGATPRRSASSRSSRRVDRSEQSSDRSSGRVTRAEVSGAKPPPPPLTDEEINAMDKLTAVREMKARMDAAKVASDPALKERLEAEAAKCRTRFREAS